MSNVLVVAESKDGKPRKDCLCCVTLGRQMAQAAGGACKILVIGSGVSGTAELFAAYGEVVKVDDPSLEHYLTETWAPVVADVAGKVGASLIAATATAQGKDLLPRVAAMLEAGMVSDILSMELKDGHFICRRPMWAGNAIGVVEVLTDVAVATVRGTEFEPAEPLASAGPIVEMEVVAGKAAGKARFVSFDATESARPDLTEANVVISGGRGTKGGDGFKLVGDLADLFGGAVGATRAAVDAGWISNDLQVGQTGKVVAPDLYMAAGISGAIQHLAGMKSSKVIVAINKDEEAPIFQVADYGLVADLFKALPELTERLKAAKE